MGQMKHTAWLNEKCMGLMNYIAYCEARFATDFISPHMRAVMDTNLEYNAYQRAIRRGIVFG
jgi:hypothetical protein